MSAPPTDFIAQLFGGGIPNSVEDMRSLLERLGGLLNAELPEVGAFHEKVAVDDVGGGRVTADVIVPKGDGPHPVLVYLHGGGWICGSPASHRKLTHRFAEAGFLVASIDYRLAPEAPFPAPFEDCVAAVRWAAREAGRWRGDASRLAIGGDSAGGNLSAAVAAALADEPDAPEIRAALLLYGVFDFATMGDAATMAGGGAAANPLAEIGAGLVDLMVGAYVGSDPSDALLTDPRLSPIHAAAKLPPSHVMVGTADPLVAQADALVARLEAAGIEHEVAKFEGMPHGFAQMEFFPQARESIGQMVAFLRKHL